jgi:hypothetical protein
VNLERRQQGDVLCPAPVTVSWKAIPMPMRLRDSQLDAQLLLKKDVAECGRPEKRMAGRG